MITPQKKRKSNPMLMKVVSVSAALHIAAILLLGGITIVEYIIPEDAQFEEPPAVEEVEPPKNVKVEIRQKPTSQKLGLQQLKMRQVGNIAVSDVDISLPSMSDSFTVSAGLGGSGLGGNLLGGARGSIGIGVSDISVFGLKSRAERVLFVIDGSKTMLTDEKGGLNSYKIIKDEITVMVANLSAGTLFNVVFYDNGRLLYFKPSLVPAGAEITQQLAQWIAPINASASKLGLSGAKSVPLKTFSDNPINEAIQKYQYSSGNESAYLTQLFMETPVDAVFIIAARHKGFERIRRSETEKEKAEWAKYVASSKYKEQMAAHQKERVGLLKKAQNKLNALNAERKAKGIPPKVIDGNGIITAMGFRFVTPNPEHSKKTFHIESNDLRRYFRDLSKKLYADRGGQPPSFNVVLFLAGDEKLPPDLEEQLESYVRFFNGKHRIIRGLDQIKSARSAGAGPNN